MKKFLVIFAIAGTTLVACDNAGTEGSKDSTNVVSTDTNTTTTVTPMTTDTTTTTTTTTDTTTMMADSTRN